jgi:hypothetical protein
MYRTGNNGAASYRSSNGGRRGTHRVINVDTDLGQVNESFTLKSLKTGDSFSFSFEGGSVDERSQGPRYSAVPSTIRRPARRFRCKAIDEEERAYRPTRRYEEEEYDEEEPMDDSYVDEEQYDQGDEYEGSYAAPVRGRRAAASRPIPINSRGRMGRREGKAPRRQPMSDAYNDVYDIPRRRGVDEYSPSDLYNDRDEEYYGAKQRRRGADIPPRPSREDTMRVLRDLRSDESYNRRQPTTPNNMDYNSSTGQQTVRDEYGSRFERPAAVELGSRQQTASSIPVLVNGAVGGSNAANTPSVGQRIPTLVSGGYNAASTPSVGQRIPTLVSGGYNATNTPSVGQRIPTLVSGGYNATSQPTTPSNMYSNASPISTIIGGQTTSSVQSALPSDPSQQGVFAPMDLDAENYLSMSPSMADNYYNNYTDDAYDYYYGGDSAVMAGY